MAPSEGQNLEDINVLTMPGIKKILEISNPLTFMLDDLSTRIKRDKPVKLSIFFTALSAYLGEPLNLFVRGESGSGKSYNVTETLKYFPEEDIWMLGGLSPTALVHEKGELYVGNGVPLRPEPIKPSLEDYPNTAEYKQALREYKEELNWYKQDLKDAYIHVDLSRKILVFLEAPSYETFRMLYPILSHDTRKIEYKFTDKTSKGKLQTTRVVIEGWPATIFCTTDTKYIEELATRSLSVTPETSTEKIREAMQLIMEKAAMPWKFAEERQETWLIKRLVQAVKVFFAGTNIVIPFANLNEIFPTELTRDMRDYTHFIQLIKAITAFHMFQRPVIKLGEKEYMLATCEDVRNALEIYADVFETTRTGTEARILHFYHETIEKKDTWYLSELVYEYNQKHVKKVSSDTMRRWLKRLSDIGYVNEEEDPNDKRLYIYRPLVKSAKSLEICCKGPMQQISNSDLQKGLKVWLENNCSKGSLYIKQKIYEDWVEMKVDDLHNFVVW